MRIKLFVILCVLVCTNAQVSRDWSFQEMCTFWGGGGSYKARDNGFNSASGDTCTFEFPVETGDQESARRYCEENVPYHINSVTSGRPTLCKAEATLICKHGWVQMFGRCYKIEKKMKTRADAVKYCKELKELDTPTPTIAFLHRETLPFRIKDRFTRVSRIWIDASEAITENLRYDVPNGHLLLALDGFKYNLPNMALARVDQSETAMVLCEYTPRMNLAESNYLLKRYGDVYYPTIFTSKTSYVRTTSNLQRNDNDRMADNKYCQKVLRPFLQSDNAQSAVPTREFLDKLTAQREAAIIRTSVYSLDTTKNSRINKECTVSNAKNYGINLPDGKGQATFSLLTNHPIWRKDEPNEACDGASWSTGIVLSRNSDKGLEAMSDARYAPLYCQTSFETMEYGNCPTGWTEYMRKDRGQKWCHKFVAERASFDDAELACQKEGAHVSGFTNQEEFDVMNKLLDDSGARFSGDPTDGTWIGAQRRKECKTRAENEFAGGFHKDVTHPCARVRVFEWVNGVASNPPDFQPPGKEELWATEYEPNFVLDENCVELLKGKVPAYYDDKDVSKKLNDSVCQYKKYYICGKEAPIYSKN